MSDWFAEACSKLEWELRAQYHLAMAKMDVEYERYIEGWDEEKTLGETVHHKGLRERVVEELYKKEDGQYDPEQLIKKAQEAGVDITKMWYYKKYQAGTLTEDDFFERWLTTQVGRGEYWKDFRDTIAKNLMHDNEQVRDIINGKLPKVYMKAYNELGGLAQKAAMEQGVTGFRFDMIDKRRLAALNSGKVDVLPYKKTGINPKKDTLWNRDKLTNALRTGILQGDPVDKLADRFQSVVGMSRHCAIVNARAAMTNAYSVGKQMQYDSLRERGCYTTKIWDDVHDSTPKPERPEHWEAHLQEVDTDKPFIVGGEELMYPGDPAGSPWNILGCRCRLKEGRFRFESILTEDQRERAKIRVKP